jgi:hypothetical protein
MPLQHIKSDVRPQLKRKVISPFLFFVVSNNCYMTLLK